MSAYPKPQEPSMEDILASIRRIISDDGQEPPRRAPTSRPEPHRAESHRAEPHRPDAGREGAQRLQGQGGPDGASRERPVSSERTFSPERVPSHAEHGRAEPARAELSRAEMAHAAPRPEVVRAGPAVTPRADGVRRDADLPSRAPPAHEGPRGEGVRRDPPPVEARPPEGRPLEAPRADGHRAEAPRAASGAPGAGHAPAEAAAPWVDGRLSRDLDLEAGLEEALLRLEAEPVAQRAAPARPVAAAPVARPAPRPAADEPAAAPPRRKDLLSPAVDAAVAAAFGSLGGAALPQQGRTVEDLMKEILRPMLKTWLDENLPDIVERLVRAEIERAARGGR